MSILTPMHCPICNDPVDLHDNDEEDSSNQNDLYIMEDCFGEHMTYAGIVHIYKCHNDHTFYMEPSMIMCPICRG